MPSELVIGNPIAKKFEIYDDAVFALIEGSGDRESVVRARQGLLSAWRGQNRRIEDFITARAVTVNSDGELGDATLSQLDGRQVRIGVVTATTDNGATVRIVDDDEDDTNDEVIQASQWFFPVQPVVDDRVLVARLSANVWVIVSLFRAEAPIVTHDDDSFTVSGPINPTIEQWQYRYRAMGDDWTESAEIDADTTTSTVSDLDQGTYAIEIRYDLFGSTGFGAWSEPTTITLLDPAPDAPSVSAVDDQGFTVDAPDGTYVEWASRRRASGVSAWIESDDLPSSQTTYVYAGLDIGDYEIQIRTRRTATSEFSAWSSTAVVSVAVLVPDTPVITAHRARYRVARPTAGGSPLARYGWRESTDGGVTWLNYFPGFTGNRFRSVAWPTDRTWTIQIRNEPVGLTPSDWSVSVSVTVKGFVLPATRDITISWDNTTRQITLEVEQPTITALDLNITHYRLKSVTIRNPDAPQTLTGTPTSSAFTSIGTQVAYGFGTQLNQVATSSSFIVGYTIVIRHDSNLGDTQRDVTFTT